MNPKLKEFIEKRLADEMEKSEAEKENVKQAYDAGALAMLFGLVNKGRLSPHEASEEASMSEAAFLEKMAEHFGAPA